MKNKRNYSIEKRTKKVHRRKLHEKSGALSQNSIVPYHKWATQIADIEMNIERESRRGVLIGSEPISQIFCRPGKKQFLCSLSLPILVSSLFFEQSK